VLIDGAPEPMLLARGTDHHLVQVPHVSRCRKTAAELISKVLAKLQRSLARRLMADQDAAGGQHFLHRPEAELEPKAELDGVADHFSRKAVTGVMGMARRVHSIPMSASCRLPVKLTVPSGDRLSTAPCTARLKFAHTDRRRSPT